MHKLLFVFFMMVPSVVISATTVSKSMLSDDTKNKIIESLYMEKLTDYEQECFHEWVVQCPSFPKKSEPIVSRDPKKSDDTQNVTVRPRDPESEPIDPEYMAAVDCRLEVLDICDIPLTRFVRPLIGTGKKNYDTVHVGYK
ncbi:hypothetical protein LJC18_02285 [Lachnospiraceae bacterium OttesenSCG-928-E19]|nr:hypothetical protein [Lachnospiraceae bacterium OttesenSCG-928-E19]